MKLLILGGTIFLGRNLVDAALKHGHEVTLFNRGQHGADLYPEVEKLRGNRDGDLEALQGRHWDAVIDPSGYVPRLVRASAELLAEAVNHYTFISSISAYADFKAVGLDENSPTGTMPDPAIETVTGETYGPLKVLCEQAAEAAIPGRVLVVQPGLIVGPNDPTDRFTYWPHRVAEGGEVLAPGRPEQPVQFIDVRDLAEWTLRMVEGNQTGVYNATGPDYTLTMAHFLDECKNAGGSPVSFTWVNEQFLAEAGVAPWVEMPLWVPDGPGSDSSGINLVNVNKAIAAGLTFRPVFDTIKDTLAWDKTRPAETERRAGLKREREAEVLTAWPNRAE